MRYSPISTVKHGVESCLGGAFPAAKKTGWRRHIYKRIDEAIYHEILGNNLVPLVRLLKLGCGWVFQHGNDLEHTASLSRSQSGLAILQT